MIYFLPPAAHPRPPPLGAHPLRHLHPQQPRQPLGARLHQNSEGAACGARGHRELDRQEQVQQLLRG